MPARLPLPEPPADDVALVQDRLRDALLHEHAAHNTLAVLRDNVNTLDAAGAPEDHREHARIELRLALRRVELWSAVVADLRAQLDAL